MAWRWASWLGLLACLGGLAGGPLAGCSGETAQPGGTDNSAGAGSNGASSQPTLAPNRFVLPPVSAVAPSVAGSDTLGEELPPVVVVGAVMSETGWLRAADAVALAALQAQTDIINEQGGINGVPLYLDVADTASNLNEAFQHGRRMAQNQVAGVFVSCDEEFALPAVQETFNSLVTMVPCPVSRWWQLDNVFAFGVSPEAEGRALAAQAETMNARSAVLFADRDSGYAQGVCRQFEQSFEAAGGVVRSTLPISYVSEAGRFSSLVRSSSLERVDVGIICSVLPTGRHLYNAMRTQGILTPVLANSQLEGEWLSQDRRQGELGVLSYGSIWGDDPAEAVNALIQRVRQNQPELQLNGTAIAAADALLAFVTAARQVAAVTPDFEATGRLDTSLLNQALDQLADTQLVSGLVSMNASENILAARQLRVVEAAFNVPPRTVAIVNAQ